MTTPNPAYVEPVSTVADLTNDHVGWLVVIDGPESRRSLVLGKGFTRGPRKGPIRRYTRPDGSEWVGICDDDTRGGLFVGTEHQFPAATPCRLERQVTRRRRR